MNCKKIIAALMCAVIPFGTAILTFETSIILSAESATVIDSGTCGDNAKWQLDRDGTFTVSGTGDMYDLRDNIFPIPWIDEKELIKKIVIGNGITRVGSQNFSFCKNLVSVKFSNTLKSVGDGSFAYCTNLTLVVLPNSVTSIEGSAFSGCNQLADITIPPSATNVKGWAFNGTPWEKEQIEKNSFLIVNGTLLAIKRDMEKAVIPDGVVCIASQSCEYGKMTELVIPDTVKTIEWNAFIDCTSLKSVIIPASVEEIKQQAFYKCESLEEICILNPECNICEHWATTISNKGEEFSGVIKGYKGSTAEKYAQKFGYTFKELDQLGDVNSDGYIDAVDASSVLAYYTLISTNKNGGYNEEQKLTADVNHDGWINAVDASNILAYYAFASTAKEDIVSIEAYMKKSR